MTTEFVLRCSRTGASLPKGIEVTTHTGRKATLVDYYPGTGLYKGDRIYLRYQDGSEGQFPPGMIHARFTVEKKEG